MIAMVFSFSVQTSSAGCEKRAVPEEKWDLAPRVGVRERGSVGSGEPRVGADG